MLRNQQDIWTVLRSRPTGMCQAFKNRIYQPSYDEMPICEQSKPTTKSRRIKERANSLDTIKTKYESRNDGEAYNWYRANQIIIKQANYIKRQRERLQRVRQFYGHQLASIKLNAEMLECHLRNLQESMQEVLINKKKSIELCNNYYRDIMNSVNELQSRGVDIYESPMLNQSSEQ